MEPHGQFNVVPLLYKPVILPGRRPVGLQRFLAFLKLHKEIRQTDHVFPGASQPILHFPLAQPEPRHARGFFYPSSPVLRLAPCQLLDGTLPDYHITCMGQPCPQQAFVYVLPAAHFIVNPVLTRTIPGKAPHELMFPFVEYTLEQKPHFGHAHGLAPLCPREHDLLELVAP